MKRIVAVILILMLVSVCAYGESMDDIMPNPALWGVSRDALKEKLKTNFKTCEVGKKKALTSSSVNIEGYTMLPYYVFGVKTWDSTGYQFMGLSKVVYILSDENIHTGSQLEECLQFFIDSLSSKIGKPHSQSDAVTRWKLNDCFVEVGKGSFKNYTGSKKATVAIAFSAIDIINPVTPSPTPRATPLPTPTPNPAQASKSKKNKNKHNSKLPESYINAGVEYVRSVIMHKTTYSHIRAVYCEDKGNGTYLFTATLQGDLIRGMGKLIRFIKTSSGKISVQEADSTIYVFTQYDTIPGTYVWGDVWDSVYNSLSNIDTNKNGEIEYYELFEP